ncbi:MAG: tetratricopeptide repeat protein, partial [Bacteroidota bacterium]
FEPPHSEIAYTLNNLASLYFDLADYDSALIYAKGGLAQRRVVFGPNHVETVASLGNVSRIYQLMKAYDSSLVYKIQMNQAMETILPPAHPYRIGGLCQIAALYLSKGEYKKAIEGYEKAVAMYKKLAEGQKKGRYPVQGRISYHGLAIGLFRIGEFGRAKEMVQRANELNESIEKPNERIRANMKVTLGRILIGQNDLAQGEKLLLEAKAYLAPLTGDARVDAYLDNIEAGLQEIKEKRNPSPEGEGA